MLKVLCTKWIPLELRKDYDDVFSFIVPEEENGKFSEAEIKELLGDADILFLASGPACPKELIDCGKKLQIIGTLGVGYDSIDVKYAAEKKIPVINSPTKVTNATAEHTVALMMACMHCITYYDRNMRKGIWENHVFGGVQTGLSGSTLGIVGMGRIGKSVAKKAKALGMSIQYCDVIPLTNSEEEEYGAKLCTFDDLLRTSDCVTVHVPLNPENYHLFDKASFDLMKDGAYFINAARGGIVDTEALVEVLKSGKLKAAGLDVFSPEPYLEGELLSLDNVIISPHVASETTEARISMAKETLDGVASLIRNEVPYNIVNPEALAR